MSGAKVKYALRVEGGANSHLFDGRLIDQDDECLAFVDVHHPITPVLAAAPELLETARNFVRWAESPSDDAVGMAREQEWVSFARKAISKATGDDQASS